MNAIDTIQVVWETLNGVLHDITNGSPDEAVTAVEYCIELLEEQIDANAADIHKLESLEI